MVFYDSSRLKVSSVYILGSLVEIPLKFHKETEERDVIHGVVPCT